MCVASQVVHWKKTLGSLCPMSSWLCPRYLLSFANFSLYPFTVINYICEYNHILTLRIPPSKLSNSPKFLHTNFHHLSKADRSHPPLTVNPRPTLPWSSISGNGTTLLSVPESDHFGITTLPSSCRIVLPNVSLWCLLNVLCILTTVISVI